MGRGYNGHRRQGFPHSLATRKAQTNADPSPWPRLLVARWGGVTFFMENQPMQSVVLILGIGTGVLSVLTFLGGAYAYIKASATKKYASEREIGHLKKSLEQLSINVNCLEQELDERLDKWDVRLLEIRDFLHRINDSNQAKKDRLD